MKYFFPHIPVTVEAETLEEAQEKIADLSTNISDESTPKSKKPTKSE